MPDGKKESDLLRLLAVARLQISQQQMLEMNDVLDGILSWVSAISEVDISDVLSMHNPLDEMTWVNHGVTETRNISDEAKFSNSSCVADGFFVVHDVLQSS